MRRQWKQGLAVICVAVAASFAQAKDLTLAERFERTARADGAAHAAGIEALTAEGERLIELCEERAGSDDVRERNLARCMLLIVREPDRVAALRNVLNDRHARFEPIEDSPGRVRIVLTTPETEPLEVGAESAPFVDETLRSAGAPMNGTAVRLLSAIADADGAPTLVRLLDVAGFSWNDPSPGHAAVGLRRLGSAALPALRGALAGEERFGAAPNWGRESARMAAAARLVAEAEDAEAIPALRSAFAHADDRTVDDIASALAALGATQAAHEIAERYVAMVEHRLNTGERQRSDDLWRLRGALLGLGEPAVAAVESAQEIASLTGLAAGVAFELEQPAAVEACFAAVLRSGVEDEWRPSHSSTVFTTGRSLWQYGDSSYGVAENPPLPMLAERALVNRDTQDAIRVLRRDPELGTPIAMALVRRDDWHNGGVCLLALAEARRSELVPIVARALAAERCRIALQYAEALLTLDTEDARRVAAEIPARAAREKRSDAPLGRAATLVRTFEAQEFDAGRVLLLVGPEDVEATSVAARILARRGDPAGVVGLVEDALLHEHSGGDQGAVQLLLRLGEAALPGLELIASGPDSLQARVAAGYVVRIGDPALTAKYDAALAVASRVESMHVVREESRINAGRRVAELGEAVLPLCDVSSLIDRSAIARYAAAILRGADPQPPPKDGADRERISDADSAMRAVSERRAATNIAAGELRQALGAAGAAEALLDRVRDAADDDTRWLGVRVVAEIVWGYPGRRHDTANALVASREEALQALLALVSSDNRVIAEAAFKLAIRRHVAAPEPEIQTRLEAWAAADEQPPDRVLTWLGYRGNANANKRLLERYEAENMGRRDLAKYFGQIEYAPASPAMWRAANEWIEHRPAYWTRIDELDALGRIGGVANLERLADLYRSEALLKVRLQAADCLALAGDARILDELAEEFTTLVDGEIAAGDSPTNVHRRRKADYITVHRPALALLRMDDVRGARVVYDALLTAPEGRVREAIAHAISMYRRENPDFVAPASRSD